MKRGEVGTIFSSVSFYSTKLSRHSCTTVSSLFVQLPMPVLLHPYSLVQTVVLLCLSFRQLPVSKHFHNASADLLYVSSRTAMTCCCQPQTIITFCQQVLLACSSLCTILSRQIHHCPTNICCTKSFSSGKEHPFCRQINSRQVSRS